MTTAKIHTYKSIRDWIADKEHPVRLYEENAALLLENAEIDYDAEFLMAISTPKKFAKIGSINGLTKTPYFLKNKNWVPNPANPTHQFSKNEFFNWKVVSEYARLEGALQQLYFRLFPNYRQDKFLNCTFRFHAARREGLHFDTFENGKPVKESAKLASRYKFFFNADREDRIWRVGPDLKSFLQNPSGDLPNPLPSDLNTLTMVIDRLGRMEDCEGVEVRIPPGGIVFANGATIAHEVVYGNRMVAIEGNMRISDRLSATPGEYDAVRQWILEAGFEVSDDYESFRHLADLPGVYKRTEHLREP